MMKNKVVAIIPAYNEEAHIASVIKQTQKYVDKVIVVDDGSRDGTYKVAKKTKAIALRHIVNMGKGVALKTGIKKAIMEKASVIITIDADGQHDPKEIPKLVKHLKNNDIVIGCRVHGEKMPFVMRAGNWGLNKIFNKLFKLDIKDTQSGFRAFKSEVYPKLAWNSQSYSVETEALVNVSRNNLKYKEVPIKTTYHDKYKGTTVIDGIKYFFNMITWKVVR